MKKIFRNKKVIALGAILFGIGLVGVIADEITGKTIDGVSVERIEIKAQKEAERQSKKEEKAKQELNKKATTEVEEIQKEDNVKFNNGILEITLPHSEMGNKSIIKLTCKETVNIMNDKFDDENVEEIIVRRVAKFTTEDGKEVERTVIKIDYLYEDYCQLNGSFLDNYTVDQFETILEGATEYQIHPIFLNSLAK